MIDQTNEYIAKAILLYKKKRIYMKKCMNAVNFEYADLPDAEVCDYRMKLTVAANYSWKQTNLAELIDGRFKIVVGYHAQSNTSLTEEFDSSIAQ